MQAHYRSDYAGEFVVLKTTWAQGRKEQQREWIENPIQNQHISGRAVCIGSNVNHAQFDYTRLQRHRGGLLSSLKVQTYGVGPVAHEMRLDFAVETRTDHLKPFVDRQYSTDNVVYTTTKNCILYPGEFYLIPQNPRLLDLMTCIYLAAFDGHSEIFLIGYNRDTPEINLDWIHQGLNIFSAYRGVKFWLVGEPTNNIPEWMECANVNTLTTRDFIGYCDI